MSHSTTSGRRLGSSISASASATRRAVPTTRIGPDGLGTRPARTRSSPRWPARSRGGRRRRPGRSRAGVDRGRGPPHHHGRRFTGASLRGIAHCAATGAGVSSRGVAHGTLHDPPRPRTRVPVSSIAMRRNGIARWPAAAFAAMVFPRHAQRRRTRGSRSSTTGRSAMSDPAPASECVAAYRCSPPRAFHCAIRGIAADRARPPLHDDGLYPCAKHGRASLQVFRSGGFPTDRALRARRRLTPCDRRRFQEARNSASRCRASAARCHSTAPGRSRTRRRDRPTGGGQRSASLPLGRQELVARLAAGGRRARPRAPSSSPPPLRSDGNGPLASHFVGRPRAHAFIVANCSW